MTVRVRFAPSPTGELHIGNARTALYNYLFARKEGGVFVLRIEDTDMVRSSPAYELSLMENLRFLGISWDEGPDIGGPYEPYRQSSAFPLYKEHLQILKEKGVVYPCFCTKEQLEEDRRIQEKMHIPPRYVGRCRNLSPEEREKKIREGLPHVYRLLYPPDEEQISFVDLIRGEVQFQVGNLGGDLVLTRADGTPTYQFAVVVDDHRMKITHVLRGEDHLTNTAKQILLYRAFGWTPPQFGHFPMILGTDRSKLSKRHGGTTVEEYRRMGVLPSALVNYLALLGWNPGDEKEVMGEEELIQLFSLSKVHSSPAVFDIHKLRWMNGVYIRSLSREKFVEEGVRWVKKFEPSFFEKVPVEIFRFVLPIYQDSIFFLEEIPRALLPLYEVGLDKKEGEKIVSMKEFPVVVLFLSRIKDTIPQETGEERDRFWEMVVDGLKKEGVSGKGLFLPLRFVLTGFPSGPDLKSLFRYIPFRLLKERIERARQWIELSHP